MAPSFPRPRALRPVGLVGLALVVLLAATAAVGSSGATGGSAASAATGSPAMAFAPSAGAAPAATARAARRGRRPNIVLVFADDMRRDEMRWMPQTRRLIGRPGTTYTQAVSENPLCCPARATLLTGRYTHNTGVMGNKTGQHGGFAYYPKRRNLPVTLRRSGYTTSYIGKFLNGYPGKNKRSMVPPGWSRWNVPAFAAYNYHHVKMNQDGKVGWRHGYRTDRYAGWSDRNLAQLARKRRPFFAVVSHLAPHAGSSHGRFSPAPPAARHRGSLVGKVPGPNGPAVDEADVSDKPSWIREAAPWDRAGKKRLQRLRRSRAEALRSVDQAVGRTIRVLKRARALRNTIVVFTSDNGFMLGEHRLTGKRVPYEESVRVPLLVRGPGFRHGVRDHRITGLVDVAATFARVARVGHQKLGYRLDGRSLLAPPLEGRAMLLQTGPKLTKGVYAKGVTRSYVAARSRDGVLIRYWNGETELYDLRSDPFQMTSVHDDPAHADLRSRLAEKLDRLTDCVGTACRH